MFRLTKLTDYGIVLLTHFAQHPEREAQNARELALETRLPLPTVGKLLKELAHEGLLVSHRGIHGGYALARKPEQISVADVIAALEGPIAITECNNTADPGLCEHESCCPVRTNWQLVNRAILQALEKISLAEMAHPLPSFWKLTARPVPLALPLSAATRGV
jgi:FeS assembly SUF system regulator